MKPTQNPQLQQPATNIPPKPRTNKKKLLIGLAAAAVLIGAGVAAYMLFKKDEPKPTATQTFTTNSTDTKVQVGEYLEIPEIGVRLRLPAEIKDAYYIIGRNFTDNDRDWAFISTKTLKDLDSGCSAEDQSKLAPGYVSYFTDPNEPYGIGEDSTISSYYPDNFKLGDKYVFYSTYQQSTCYGDGVYGTDKGNQIDAIYKLFKQARLEGIDSPKTDPATPTDKDVTEINKLVESFCQGAGGYSGIKITKEHLTTKKEGNTPYYNGYAIIAVGCKNDGGGYQSYMQRQADNSYKQLFGAQDVPDCDKVDQYKIPKQILSTCEVPTTGNEPADFRDNTN